MRVVIAEFMDQAAVEFVANYYPTHCDPELVDRRDELTARMARGLAMRVISFDAQIESGDAVRLRSPRGRSRPPRRTGA